MSGANGPLTGSERALVEQAHVARLATVRPDGTPHLVPVTFALTADALVFAVDHKPKGSTDLQRLRNIDANGFASVLVDHYEDDWSRLWWVRLDGPAVVLRDEPARTRALAPLVAKYQQYRTMPPAGPVVVVTVRSWAAWSC